MKIITDSQFFSSLILMLRIVRGNQSTVCENMCTDVFLVAPGDGKEFVYSPVGVNATLQCAVSNAELVWAIDFPEPLFFGHHSRVLNSRGIFQNGDINTSSDGVTISSITVFGNREMNNNTRICCQAIMGTMLPQNCTKLIIYGMTNNIS